MNTLISQVGHWEATVKGRNFIVMVLVCVFVLWCSVCPLCSIVDPFVLLAASTPVANRGD